MNTYLSSSRPASRTVATIDLPGCSTLTIRFHPASSTYVATFDGGTHPDGDETKSFESMDQALTYAAEIAWSVTQEGETH